MKALLLVKFNLIHPVLPGGREFTVYFSPTRKKIANQIERFQCANCRAKPSKKQNESDLMEDKLDTNQLEEEFEGDIDDHLEATTCESLSEIDGQFCKVKKYGIRHFACEKCRLLLPTNCPKCEKFVPLLRRDDAPGAKLYGQDCFLGGFHASDKLKKVVSDFKATPSKDKVIVVSSGKGALDLLERMFVEECPNQKILRFDGDETHKKRKEKTLSLFRKNPSYRLLLMTVQSGGVGLNLAVANHMLITDRNCKYWLSSSSPEYTMIIETNVLFCTFAISKFNCSSTMRGSMP